MKENIKTSRTYHFQKDEFDILELKKFVDESISKGADKVMFVNEYAHRPNAMVYMTSFRDITQEERIDSEIKDLEERIKELENEKNYKGERIN
jgi:hypothetical protein